MKTVIIHGQSHEGSTCHLARILANKLEGEIIEFFLPRDFNKFCTGCGNCFLRNENLCPHHLELQPIIKAVDNADVIILASPVYVYHVTGSMKALLDHFAYRWMVHRPSANMFTKQVVCLSTAAGAGTRSTNKDLADSAFFWGCGKIYKLGVNVREVKWSGVSKKIKSKIEIKTSNMANKIKRNYQHIKPTIKTRTFFYIMRLIQKKGWNEADRDYWVKNGWVKNKRPWK